MDLRASLLSFLLGMVDPRELLATARSALPSRPPESLLLLSSFHRTSVGESRRLQPVLSVLHSRLTPGDHASKSLRGFRNPFLSDERTTAERTVCKRSAPLEDDVFRTMEIPFFSLVFFRCIYCWFLGEMVDHPEKTRLFFRRFLPRFFSACSPPRSFSFVCSRSFPKMRSFICSSFRRTRRDRLVKNPPVSMPLGRRIPGETRT